MLSPARRFAGFVVIGSLVAALINLAGSVAVPLESQPVLFRGSGSLGSLIVSEQAHVIKRFGLYGQLRDLVGGGSVIVPDMPILDRYTLVHFSKVDVEVEDYPVELTEEQAEALMQDVRFSGEGEMVISSRDVYPYVVVGTSDAMSTMRVVLFGDTVFIVEESLYAEVVGTAS